MQYEKMKSEVVTLHIAGGHTGRQMAKRFGVSEQTICNWIKKSQKVKYHCIKLSLEKELNKLVNKGDYLKNAQAITGLISDIERIEVLVNKTKY